MADFDYSEVRAVAKELIEEFGREVTVVHQGNTPTDAGKPWGAQSATVRGSVTGKAAFVATGSLATAVGNSDNVKSSDQVALFAAANDGGSSLEYFDLIIDGLVNWKITKTELLSPGNTRLLYLFVVEKL